MYIHRFGWFQYKNMANTCLILFFVQFILIVDSVKPEISSTNRQMCSKFQSMLSYGKYQTTEMSSNITYVPRLYTQSFLAYSSIDELLVFVEPKHQIHVYNARTVQLIVNISTTDVVIATSCTSLLSDSPHDLYFIYENSSTTNLISLRVCQVRLNIYKLNFDHYYCIETLKIQYDRSDLRIYGFTIKRDHAGTNKSLLFISTEIGLLYTIFDTRTGSLIKVPQLLNETLNEGSVVLSPSSSIYYASKQEHIIYELRISRDFRLRYGNITKNNAIKSPFGLITDECNHLYIATRSMIMIIYTQNSATIRSVFAKESDIPFTLERLNITTYVYMTIKRNTGKIRPIWMFNFLYFTESEKFLPTTRHPATDLEENLDFDITAEDDANIPVLWPLSYVLLSMTNTSKIYTSFSSTPRKPFTWFRKNKLKQPQTTVSDNQEALTTDQYELFTSQPPSQTSTLDASEEFHAGDPDYDLENIEDSQFDHEEQRNELLDQDRQSETPTTSDERSSPYSSLQDMLTTIKPSRYKQNNLNTSENIPFNEDSHYNTSSINQQSDSYFDLKYRNTTVHPQQTLLNSSHSTIRMEETFFSNDELQSYIQGRSNLSQQQQTQIQAYLNRPSSTVQSILSQYSFRTKVPTRTYTFDDHSNHSTQSEDTQLEEYLQTIPLIDSKYFNISTDSQQILVPIDDLRSYLQGGANLTDNQKTQIQAYLAQQSSADPDRFHKYFVTVTNAPQTSSTSKTMTHSQFDDDEEEDNKKSDYYSDEMLPYDLEYFNRTNNSDQLPFTVDDLQLYLQGRSNLSRSQEVQIQAFLARQSSSNESAFYKYGESTRRPTRIYTSDSKIRGDDQTRNTKLEELLRQIPLGNSTHFNISIDSEEILIPIDDARLSLQGHGNLSRTQEIQIEAYLNRQLSSSPNTVYQYRTSTTRSTRIYTSDNNIYDDDGTRNATLEELLRQIQLGNSTHFNISTDSEEIFVPVEDLRSYLQGQSNLSTSQEAHIQAYLARQSSSDSNSFSKYLTSTPTSRKSTSTGGDNTQNQLATDDSLSTTARVQLEDHSEELLPFDFEEFNRTVDSETMLFSVDDIRSYLSDDRGNLSSNQKTQIQNYLARQPSSNRTTLYKHRISTASPSRISTSDNDLHRQDENEDVHIEELLKYIPQTDSNYLNISVDSEEVLISPDDFRSYLQGHGNLSEQQETQIQTYLSKQSSSDPNLFSKYWTTTNTPSRFTIPTKNTQSQFDGKNTHSVTDATQSDYYSEEVLPYNLEHFNRTNNSDQILFTVDDLRSYLKGNANLTNSQKTQIQAYLAIQSSSSQSTRRPTTLFTSDNNLHRDDIHEDASLEEFLKQIPVIDSKYFNLSTSMEEILVPIDDLRSYLQGSRGNLSQDQEEQIQVYLSQQASANPNMFSKYLTSTQIPGTFVSSRNQLLTEDTSMPVNLDELLPLDFKYFNDTTYSNEILFTGDDLRTYLQGGTNLTSSQKVQIQTYLAKQSSPNRTLFYHYTKSPTNVYTSANNLHDESNSEETKLDAFLNMIPLINSTHFNISTTVEEVLIPVTDLQSYLQGRTNLTSDQEIQFQAYLNRRRWTNHSTVESNNSTEQSQTRFSLDDLRSYLQSNSNQSSIMQAQIQSYMARHMSTNQILPSKHPRTTPLPNNIFTSDNDLYRQDENEDVPIEELLKNIPQIDSNHLNISVDSEEVLISPDDFRSYLQGRGNLSENQQSQIRAYLSKQSPDNPNIFPKYLTTTQIPTNSVSNGNQSPTQDISTTFSSEELLPLDFQDFNYTIGSEEILFNIDDLRSYLHGGKNLTTSQKTQIQAYLAHQPSLNHTFVYKYTKSPTTISTSDHNVYHDDSNENAKIDEFLQTIPLIDSKYFNISTDSQQILVPIDDLRSYLQGGANLTDNQKTQIQGYLDKQSSADPDRFHKYFATVTNAPQTSSTSKTMTHSQFDDEEEEDNKKSDDYTDEILPYDLEYFNRTNNSDQLPFTVDDLHLYLQGRSNLSRSQEVQIQAFLARQSSSNESAFYKYGESTRRPTRIYTSDSKIRDGDQTRNTKLEELLRQIPLGNSTHFNVSIDSEEILIPIDDARLYLQGHGNLSRTQEIQIEAYLNRQLSSSPSAFYQYRTSTNRPIRISTPDNNIHGDDVTRNATLEALLRQIPLGNSTHFNISTDSEEILIPVEDLRSYLQGQSNLSTSQEAQIDAYLNRQSLSNPSTSRPTRIYTSDDNIFHDYQKKNMSLEELLKLMPLINSTHFNLSTNSENILVPVDELRSYLQGHGNLSLNQEAQLQSYLAKQPSSDNSTLIRYFLGTKKPTDTFTTRRSWSSIINDTESSSDDTEQSFNGSPINYSSTTQSGTNLIDNNATLHTNTYEQQKTTVHVDDKVDFPDLSTKRKTTLHPSFSSQRTPVINIDSTTSRKKYVGEKDEDENYDPYSSSMSPDIHVSSTLHPLSPFVISNTTPFPSHPSYLSSLLPNTRVYSSTRSPKSTRISSSKRFSESKPKITTKPSRPNTVSSSSHPQDSSHKFSSIQTTNIAITSDIPEQKVTDSYYTSTISSALPSIRTEQSSSASYAQSTEITDHTYSSTSTTIIPNVEFDSWSKKLSDKTSTHSVITIDGRENLKPLETTEKLPLSSSRNDRNQNDVDPDQPSFDWTTTNFPHSYRAKTSSTLPQFPFDQSHSTTTVRRFRSRRPKITRWQTQQSSTISASSSSTMTTPLSLYETTSIDDLEIPIDTERSNWHSEWNPLKQQQTIIIKPLPMQNDSNTYLSNDLLNKIFTNISTSTNSSTEKLIYVNLIDLPPSTWDLSLKSNESIILDVALPSPTFSFNSTTKTNLTFTDIEADRFSTNIIGQPVNLHIDHVHTKDFSLKMNATNDDFNSTQPSQYFSDIFIGHIISERFNLNLTKLNPMHVHIQRVDTATADLYLDSSFCTNESSLDINLNLSKNGTIRYGNRAPIHIGPVFTRVHLRKQSCDHELSLVLFFDVCARQNPCSNGGSCVSLIPDYDNISFSDQEIGYVGYRCTCPIHTRGEHCEYLDYPFGYCFNDGTFIQIYDQYNRSIEKCICSRGFRGEYCEENIDNCPGIDCSNHGICEDGIETYTCSCFDGFYGLSCERKKVETVILQTVSRSFGIIAIIIIAAIAALVVASDIHTYTMRKYEKNNLLNADLYGISTGLENSMLLFGFRGASIEMNDLSIAGGRRTRFERYRPRRMKQTTRTRKPIAHRQIARRRRPVARYPISSSKHYLLPNQSN